MPQAPPLPAVLSPWGQVSATVIILFVLLCFLEKSKRSLTKSGDLKMSGGQKMCSRARPASPRLLSAWFLCPAEFGDPGRVSVTLVSLMGVASRPE